MLLDKRRSAFTSQIFRVCIRAVLGEPFTDEKIGFIYSMLCSHMVVDGEPEVAGAPPVILSPTRSAATTLVVDLVYTAGPSRTSATPHFTVVDALGGARRWKGDER